MSEKQVPRQNRDQDQTWCEWCALGEETAALLDELLTRQDVRADTLGVKLAGKAYLFSRTPDCSQPLLPDGVTQRYGRRAASGDFYPATSGDLSRPWTQAPPDIEGMTAQAEIFGPAGGTSDSALLRVLDELSDRLTGEELPARRLAKVLASSRASVGHIITPARTSTQTETQDAVRRTRTAGRTRESPPADHEAETPWGEAHGHHRMSSPRQIRTLPCGPHRPPAPQVFALPEVAPTREEEIT